MMLSTTLKVEDRWVSSCCKVINNHSKIMRSIRKRKRFKTSSYLEGAESYRDCRNSTLGK
jgi:hypothetical protein